MNLIVTVWRLWLKTFSISSILFLQSLCLQPAYPIYLLCTLCLLSFHHDDCVTALLCLLLSSYSIASCSWLRKFLTLNFLSDEFVKITDSPTSSRYNALSIGIRYSLVLFDFGLTTWSFSYVNCRNEESDMLIRLQCIYNFWLLRAMLYSVLDE